MDHHQSRTVKGRDDIGVGKGLAGSGSAFYNLDFLILIYAFKDFPYGIWLVARWRKGGY